jgi:hypothetical protein
VLWYGWQITVQGRAGLESIEDLGPPASIDAQRGFGLSREDLLEGGSAEVRSARKRKDSMGQVYYEWCVHALPSLPTSPTAAGSRPRFWRSCVATCMAVAMCVPLLSSECGWVEQGAADGGGCHGAGSGHCVRRRAVLPGHRRDGGAVDGQPDGHQDGATVVLRRQL